jgi:hypothetical protein
MGKVDARVFGQAAEAGLSSSLMVGFFVGEYILREVQLSGGQRTGNGQYVSRHALQGRMRIMTKHTKNIGRFNKN